MNLRNKSHFLVIFSILIYEVKSAKVCCSNNGTIMSAWKCKDGSAVKVTCDRSLYNIINPDNGFRNHFIINHDDRGEYLDVYLLGYSIYEPDFCLGPYYASFLNRNTTVAVVCLSQRVWYSNQNRTGVAEAIGEVTFLKIYNLLTFIFNLLSGLAFLITAGIYFFLPDVQDLQGTCYFHLTLTAALGHLTFTYIELFDTEGLLPDMCITNAYLTMYLVLSAFSWLSVSSFNIWRQIRNLYNGNEEKLKQHYQLVAYGVPAFLVLFTFLHVHILDRDEDFSFVLSCAQHQNRILNTYVQFPILLSLLLNILMFLNNQINICNLHTIQLSDKKLMGKIVKYRIFMNVKLFFTTGIPWSFMIIVSLLGSMSGNNDYFSYLSLFAEFLILGEGVPIFLILVLFRKRVLRGVANRWLTNTPSAVDKWKTVHDSETEEDNENEEERRADNGHHNFEVRFDKTNNINQENLNNHDSPPIVIF